MTIAHRIQVFQYLCLLLTRKKTIKAECEPIIEIYCPEFYPLRAIWYFSNRTMTAVRLPALTVVNENKTNAAHVPRLSSFSFLNNLKCTFHSLHALKLIHLYPISFSLSFFVVRVFVESIPDKWIVSFDFRLLIMSGRKRIKLSRWLEWCSYSVAAFLSSSLHRRQ